MGCTTSKCDPHPTASTPVDGLQQTASVKPTQEISSASEVKCDTHEGTPHMSFDLEQPESHERGAPQVLKGQQSGIRQQSAKLDSKSSGGQLTPPLQDVHTFNADNPDGFYLVYADQNSGTFLGKYSKNPVPGALAFARPSEYQTIAGFKYKKPVHIQSNTDNGRTMYFQAWGHWLKEARNVEAEFVLLDGLEDREASVPSSFPVFNMYFISGSKVIKIEKGLKNKPYKLKFADAVAIVSENYTVLDALIKSGSEVDRCDFASKARAASDKFYMEFKAQ